MSPLKVPLQLPFAPKEAWRVTQGNNGAASHQGISEFCWDFERVDGDTLGQPVFAAASGTVAYVDDGKEYLYVEHAPDEFVVYLHIDSNSVTLKEGDRVQLGQKLAAIGEHPNGAHLHFALSNIVGKEPQHGGAAGFTTIPAEFSNYESLNTAVDPPEWKYVSSGIPEEDEQVRRSSRWSSWVPRDKGVLKGAPSVISRSPQLCELFGRGLDDRTWQNTYQSGKGWGGWFSHNDGFVLGSQVTVGSMQPDHLHLFALDANGGVWQKWWPTT